jgi:hypothetical protein
MIAPLDHVKVETATETAYYYFEEEDAIPRCAELQRAIDSMDLADRQRLRHLLQSWRMSSARKPLTMAENAVAYVLRSKSV